MTEPIEIGARVLFDPRTDRERRAANLAEARPWIVSDLVFGEGRYAGLNSAKVHPLGRDGLAHEEGLWVALDRLTPARASNRPPMGERS